MPPKSRFRPLRLGSFNFDASRNCTYPSLFEEADDMIALSNLIYTLVELRELARNGIMSNPAKSLRLLELPLPTGAALSVFASESELLKEVLGDGKHESTVSAVKALIKQQRSNGGEGISGKKQLSQGASPDMLGGWLDGWNQCLSGTFSFDEIFCGSLGQVNGETNKDNTENVPSIIAVGDTKSKSELVYMIDDNPVQKRITVVFRGSVTKTDAAIDAKTNLARVPDPRKFAESLALSDLDEFDIDIGIHQGFYDYLLGTIVGGKSKYTEILTHINDLLDKEITRCKDYKLYVTGHGLGGALATLFGFYFAASLPHLPVTVVSAASPCVGNSNFARAFTELESQGKLRHLRITNNDDPVTFGPTVSSNRALSLASKALSPLGHLAMKVTGMEAGDDETYHHTGINLKFFKEVINDEPKFDLSHSCASLIMGLSGSKSINGDTNRSFDDSSRKRSFGKNSVSITGKNLQDSPLVSCHYGEVYVERLLLVRSDLTKLALNDVYAEKASKK